MDIINNFDTNSEFHTIDEPDTTAEYDTSSEILKNVLQTHGIPIPQDHNTYIHILRWFIHEYRESILLHNTKLLQYGFNNGFLNGISICFYNGLLRGTYTAMNVFNLSQSTNIFDSTYPYLQILNNLATLPDPIYNISSTVPFVFFKSISECIDEDKDTIDINDNSKIVPQNIPLNDIKVQLECLLPLIHRTYIHTYTL